MITSRNPMKPTTIQRTTKTSSTLALTRYSAPFREHPPCARYDGPAADAVRKRRGLRINSPDARNPAIVKATPIVNERGS